MDPKIKNQWLTALRSGLYRQGHEALHTITTDGWAEFCCLGVLCDIVRNDVGLTWDEDGEPDIDGEPYENQFLPRPVVHRAHLDDHNPTVPYSAFLRWFGDDEDARTRLMNAVHDSGYGVPENPDDLIPLSVLNDGGFTFDEIAHLIEIGLPGETP